MELFQEPIWMYIITFLAGVLAYIISTLSGGGGSLLLVPLVSKQGGNKAKTTIKHKKDKGVEGCPSTTYRRK